MSDSQLIIEHLMKKHNIQMLKLTPEETAVARSMRALVEDNLVSKTSLFKTSNLFKLVNYLLCDIVSGCIS